MVPSQNGQMVLCVTFFISTSPLTIKERHVGENVSEQHFFNHLFGKLLQGLNVAQIVAIIVIIFFAVIIVVLLIANIIGDKKKVGFYLFGLLACGLGVVFIYFAKDIFAAFVSWTAN